ncbi:MAG: hypothetical protein AB1656_16180 [Candidatus Omnitrophota bacterium]
MVNFKKIIALLFVITFVSQQIGLCNKLEIISVGMDGKPAGGCISLGGISDDKRYVVFISLSNQIVPGDTNWVSTDPFASSSGWDVFVRDRQEQKTTRINLTNEGKQIEKGNSTKPTISGDGNMIAYQSDAWDIVPSDQSSGYGVYDIFVHNRSTNKTEMITSFFQDDFVQNANAYQFSYNPYLSKNGKYTAYTHFYMINGVGSGYSIHRFDLIAHKDEAALDGDWSYPAINADGRYIVASSSFYVGVKDMETGEITVISKSPSGDYANGECTNPHISGDGRFILYESEASNLVPDDPHKSPYLKRGIDSFIYDRETKETTLVSLGEYDSTSYDNGARGSSLSPDGRYVIFCNYNETATPIGLYRFDRITKKTDRLITDAEINQAYNVKIIGFGGSISISPDNKTVVFLGWGDTSAYSVKDWYRSYYPTNVFLLELDDNSEIGDWPLQ